QLTLGRAQGVLVQAPAAPGVRENAQVLGAGPQLLEPPRVPARPQPAARRARMHPCALGELAHGEPSVACHAAVAADRSAILRAGCYAGIGSQVAYGHHGRVRRLLDIIFIVTSEPLWGECSAASVFPAFPTTNPNTDASKTLA